jgi:hypothetical protein
MLHPFWRQIEQLEPPLLEILNHAALLKPGQARVKRRRSDLPLPHGGDLILHQGNERRNHQGQSWQESRRQLIAERLAQPSRHDRHRIAPSQHGANDFLLTRPKLRKAEPFAELLSQIIHGEIRKTMECWGPCARAEYRRLTHCGQVERDEVERSSLSLQLNGTYVPAGRDFEGLQTQSLTGLGDSDKRFRKPSSPPSFSLFGLTQAYWSQGGAKSRTLAGVRRS